VLAQPACRSWSTLLWRDIVARSALIVVVIYTVIGWLFLLIHGVEGGDCHSAILLKTDDPTTQSSKIWEVFAVKFVDGQFE
jgi:hypothetical protein